MKKNKKQKNIKLPTLLLKCIIALLILIVIVLIIKFFDSKNWFSKTISDEVYNQNITLMKDVGLQYFKENNLPSEVGKSKTVSLKELIGKKLLIDFTENNRLCSLDDSYIEASISDDGNYFLKTYLKCGEKEDYVLSTIESIKNSCENNTTSKEKGDIVSSGDTNKTNDIKENKTTIIKQDISNMTFVSECINCCKDCSENETQPDTKPEINKDKITYYKLVKYTDWTKEVITGENVEEKTILENISFDCVNSYNKTYYIMGVMSNNTLYNTSYNYNLLINDLTGVKDVKIVSSNYFTSNADYTAFMKQLYKPYFLFGDTVDGKVCVNKTSSLISASLNKNHFTYSLGNIYQKNNNYYVPINITYKNAFGVEAICNCYTQEKILFTPIKLNISYKKDEICESKKEIKYYRTYTYKWSLNKYEEGYTYTGISEQRDI